MTRTDVDEVDVGRACSKAMRAQSDAAVLSRVECSRSVVLHQEGLLGALRGFTPVYKD